MLCLLLIPRLRSRHSGILPSVTDFLESLAVNTQGDTLMHPGVLQDELRLATKIAINNDHALRSSVGVIEGPSKLE